MSEEKRLERAVFLHRVFLSESIDKVVGVCYDGKRVDTFTTIFEGLSLMIRDSQITEVFYQRRK